MRIMSHFISKFFISNPPPTRLPISAVILCGELRAKEWSVIPLHRDDRCTPPSAQDGRGALEGRTSGERGAVGDGQGVQWDCCVGFCEGFGELPGRRRSWAQSLHGGGEWGEEGWQWKEGSHSPLSGPEAARLGFSSYSLLYTNLTCFLLAEQLLQFGTSSRAAHLLYFSKQLLKPISPVPSRAPFLPNLVTPN